jgi:hypothetical protein
VAASLLCSTLKTSLLPLSQEPLDKSIAKLFRRFKGECFIPATVAIQENVFHGKGSEGKGAKYVIQVLERAAQIEDGLFGRVVEKHKPITESPQNSDFF